MYAESPMFLVQVPLHTVGSPGSPIFTTPYEPIIDSNSNAVSKSFGFGTSIAGQLNVHSQLRIFEATLGPGLVLQHSHRRELNYQICSSRWKDSSILGSSRVFSSLIMTDFQGCPGEFDQGRAGIYNEYLGNLGRTSNLHTLLILLGTLRIKSA